MVFAAAGFVDFFRADHDDWVVIVRGAAIDEALSTACMFTTDNTDRVELGHFFSMGE